MDDSLEQKLIDSARVYYSLDDPSHDFEHILRVLANAKTITAVEGGDLEIIVPAVLFHDAINYPKDSPKAQYASTESAELVTSTLSSLLSYPREKIEAVAYAVSVCSFSKGIVPDTHEAKILQDADGLEATGAIAIMRTYASTGQMKRPFYHIDDPFCDAREPDGKQYALDLFYERLLKIEERCHTETAKQIAHRRTRFLLSFLDEFKFELRGE